MSLLVRVFHRIIDQFPYLVKLRYEKAYKLAIAYEEHWKKECRKEMKEYKDGKRKHATTKVYYVYPNGFKYGRIAAEIFNERNGNDKPWFQENKNERK